MIVPPPVPVTGLDTAVALTPPVAPASPAAARQFNEIMQATASGTSPVPTVADASGLTAPGPVSLGNQILDSLQGSSRELSGRWQFIAEHLSQKQVTPTVTDLLQVQTQLLQISIHYELIGKAISKSAQNIDTMVKLQ